jgi:hypothetical protein
MTKVFLGSLALFLSVSLMAQNDNVGQDTAAKKFSKDAVEALNQNAKDTAWKVGGNLGIQFNQAAYENWQAGGVNSIAGNGLLNIFANYDNGGKWTWVNNLNLGYGLNFLDTVFNKTDDRIELESRIDYTLNKRWGLSALYNFRSQFAAGFSKPGETADSVKISDFMAPGYMLIGLGATFKPNKKISVFLSPATAKLTFVMDERLSNLGAFGVDSGATLRAELGGYLNFTYQQTLLKNVDLKARLDLFSNYLDDPTLIDVNSEILLFLKVNKYISANVAFNVIYDHDVKFDVDGKMGVPRTQFRQLLGVGFAYNFGAQK